MCIFVSLVRNAVQNVFFTFKYVEGVAFIVLEKKSWCVSLKWRLYNEWVSLKWLFREKQVPKQSLHKVKQNNELQNYKLIQRDYSLIIVVVVFFQNCENYKQNHYRLHRSHRTALPVRFLFRVIWVTFLIILETKDEVTGDLSCSANNSCLGLWLLKVL